MNDCATIECKITHWCCKCGELVGVAPKSNWIKCTPDTMPPFGLEVLIFETGSIIMASLIDWSYIAEEPSWAGPYGSIPLSQVTHWHHLPTPPEE